MAGTTSDQNRDSRDRARSSKAGVGDSNISALDVPQQRPLDRQERLDLDDLLRLKLHLREGEFLLDLL